ncbi:hypothetical protein L9F63_008267, partial [Diploptera punctata]
MFIDISITLRVMFKNVQCCHSSEPFNFRSNSPTINPQCGLCDHSAGRNSGCWTIAPSPSKL